LSPAKATRPGFRQSIGVNDGQLSDQSTINLFHPIYHSFTYPIGCRIDVERILPADIDGEDDEELVDNFSEPPVWIERFSPLAVQIGDQVLRGKNAPDLMLKLYRLMFDLFQGIGRFIDSTINQSLGHSGRFPFMSLTIDPDTIHRIIEADFEQGETTYPALLRLFGEGYISPCLTTPFHVLLPRLASDSEIRVCIRSAFIFYLRIIRIYTDFLEANGESGLTVVPFWLPEGAVSSRVVDILNEEFEAFCKREKLRNGHLVLLLDNHQANFHENDVLMKSWNQIVARRGANGNGRLRKRERDESLHEGVQRISVLFRDRTFSDWVIHANPSVKKLLDRTIAKVDSDINQQNVHYGWGHFEELESMTFTPRAIINFQQKLVKLTELGYLPLSPDFYIRGKLRGEFGCTHNEPQVLEMPPASVGNGWNLSNATCFGRWDGLRQNPETGAWELDARPYERPGDNGARETMKGNPCWKIAWNRAREACYRAVVGDLAQLKGGMAEVLAGLSGQTDPDKARRNVEDFLANYTYVYWREFFIQHDMAEADINIIEIVNKHLRAGVKGELAEADCARAGAAAQAIFFALESGRSMGSGWENMDQRSFYQNVVMLTLAICNAMYVHHWMGQKAQARKLLSLLQTELLDFENAYTRHNLAEFGVSQKDWKEAIRSEVSECRDNVVRRAALRIAARHLRPLGYTREFTRQDANITTNVGHMWSIESCRENFCYENTAFCGVLEA